LLAQIFDNDPMSTYVELVDFIQKSLTPDTRFFKRFMSNEGRYYYQDIRTGSPSPSPLVSRARFLNPFLLGKTQWLKPPGFTSVIQLASMVRRFYSAARRQDPLTQTQDGVPYDPPIPTEPPPVQTLR